MRRAVAAVACAIALGGCAEDESDGPLSKAEYEQRFREIARESEEAAPDSPPAAESPQEQAQQIDTGLDRFREVADKLAKLEPPPDIARAHAMFVAGLRATADDAEKLVRALRAGDGRRAEAMLDNGTLFKSAAARKVGRARHEFSDKGYDLGGVSEFP
jgi:hypothetical protein